MTCMSCCSSARKIHPPTALTTPSIPGPTAQPKDVDDRCHKCTYRTFQCISCSSTGASGGVAAWAFATGNIGLGVLSIFPTISGCFGTVAFSLYASVHDMDAIVTKLGGTSIKFEATEAAMSKKNDDLIAENTQLKNEVTTLTTTVKEYQTSVATVRTENQTLEDNRKKLETINEELKQEATRYNDLLQKTLEAVKPFGDISSALQRIVNDCVKKSAEMSAAEAKLLETLQKGTGQTDAINKLKVDIERQSTEVNSVLGTIQATCKERASQLDTMQKLYSNLANAADPYNKLIVNCKTEIAALEAKISERTATLHAINIDILAKKPYPERSNSDRKKHEHDEGASITQY